MVYVKLDRLVAYDFEKFRFFCEIEKDLRQMFLLEYDCPVNATA